MPPNSYVHSLTLIILPKEQVEKGRENHKGKLKLRLEDWLDVAFTSMCIPLLILKHLM
jgi:hypothetical protein